MTRLPTREEIANQLHTALETETESEKNFHVRQALQLLDLRDDPS